MILFPILLVALLSATLWTASAALVAIAQRMPLTGVSLGVGPTVFKVTLAGIPFQLRILPIGGGVQLAETEELPADLSRSAHARRAAISAMSVGVLAIAAIATLGDEAVTVVASTIRASVGLFGVFSSQTPGIGQALEAFAAAPVLQRIGYGFAVYCGFCLLPLSFQPLGAFIADAFAAIAGRPLNARLQEIWLKVSLAAALALVVTIILSLVASASVWL